MVERKNRGVGIIIGIAVFFILVASAFVILQNTLQPTVVLRLGDGIFHARVIPNKNDANLSYLETSSDTAMLATFSSDNRWDVDTQGIKVPVDIVWLNSDKKVVYIVKNASEENSKSVIFSSKTMARYIVKFPAGTVKNKAIGINSEAFFQLDSNGA